VTQNNFLKLPSVQFALLFIIVFLSRLPFLPAGYGVDVDGWRFAAVARNIAVTGQYGYSRVPGHPFQEIIASFFWKEGPSVLNGMTALMSAVAAIFFALIMKRLGFKNYLLPALAFAFTPLIYINSTNSMDYVWALALILGSLYFVLGGKPIFAGIFLGLAIACRATSGFMLIPFIMILHRNRVTKNIFKFILIAGLIGILFYIPAYLRYGFDFLKDFTGPYPGAVYVLFRMFISTWGLIGFAAIVIALIIQIYKRNQNQHADKYLNRALLTAIGIYFPLFLVMPYKATYLIPIIPLILILLMSCLQPALRNFVCVSLIVSSFLAGASRPELNILPEYTQYSVNLGNNVVIDFLKGPVLSDNSKRLKQLDYVNKILETGDSVSHKSVVVTGESYPLIDVTLPYNIQGNVIYEYLLDSTKLEKYRVEGYAIYYLPDEEKSNLELYNVNLIENGAKPFLKQ
jgi:hypothetical protein